MSAYKILNSLTILLMLLHNNTTVVQNTAGHYTSLRSVLLDTHTQDDHIRQCALTQQTVTIHKHCHPLTYH